MLQLSRVPPQRRQTPARSPATAGHADPLQSCTRTQLKPPTVPPPPCPSTRRASAARGHVVSRAAFPPAGREGDHWRSLPLSADGSLGSAATPRTFWFCTACSQRAKWPQSKCGDASVPGGQLEKVSVNASFTQSQTPCREPGGRTSRSGNGSAERSSGSGAENKGAFMQRTMAGSERGRGSCESRPPKTRPSLAVGGEIPA